jgi:hypothetical protein
MSCGPPLKAAVTNAMIANVGAAARDSQQSALALSRSIVLSLATQALGPLRRAFGLIANQLALTYDLRNMSVNQLMKILPSEFR